MRWAFRSYASAKLEGRRIWAAAPRRAAARANQVIEDDGLVPAWWLEWLCVLNPRACDPLGMHIDTKLVCGIVYRDETCIQVGHVFVLTLRLHFLSRTTIQL